MKIATGLFTGAALLLGQVAMAQVSPATAAVPNFSGKYAYFHIFNCEAQISTTIVAGKVTSVNLTSPGRMDASVGYIILTPSSLGAASGTATFTPSTQVGGGAVKINGNSDLWSKSVKTQTPLAYSFTAATFTIGSQAFAMTYGNHVGGIDKTINMVSRDQDGSNVDCLAAITLTKQP